MYDFARDHSRRRSRRIAFDGHFLIGEFIVCRFSGQRKSVSDNVVQYIIAVDRGTVVPVDEIVGAVSEIAFSVVIHVVGNVVAIVVGYFEHIDRVLVDFIYRFVYDELTSGKGVAARQTVQTDGVVAEHQRIRIDSNRVENGPVGDAVADLDHLPGRILDVVVWVRQRGVRVDVIGDECVPVIVIASVVEQGVDVSVPEIHADVENLGHLIRIVRQVVRRLRFLDPVVVEQVVDAPAPVRAAGVPDVLKGVAPGGVVDEQVRRIRRCIHADGLSRPAIA
ncbi:MAG: hypothetical protein BWY66_01395 [bacterium ADurb.Bin374]|nr:MAG: hypothetical protein BWY66_01395 [bacterium ADurb.Bin374]